MKSLQKTNARRSFTNRKKPDLFSRYEISPEGLAVALYLFSTVFDFLAIAPGVSFARLTGLILLALAFLKFKALCFPRDAGLVFSYLLLLFGSVALLLAPITSASLNAFFSLAINVLLLLVVASFHYERNDIRLCEAALVAAGIAICILMLVSPGNAGGQWETRVVVNIAGSQQDPNELCGYFIFPIAYCTYRGLKEGRPFLLAIVVLCLYSTLLTGSRGGLIACFVVLASAVYLGFIHSKHRVLYSALVILIALLLIWNIDNVISLLPSSFADRFSGVNLVGGTASQRMKAWGNVWENFLSSGGIGILFGHGFGSTTTVTFNGLVAHNSFLEVLYTLGICGFTFYCLLIGKVLLLAKSIKNYQVIAAVIGFMALIMTLSSYSFKPMWAVWMLAYIAIKPHVNGNLAIQDDERL